MVDAVTLLFGPFVSTLFPVMVAVLTTVPAAAGWGITTMVTVTAAAPALSVPRFAVTRLPEMVGMIPTEVVADWICRPAGTLSVTTALGSVDGPLLDTVIV